MAFDGTLKFDTEIVTEGFKSGLEKIDSFAKKGMALVAGAVTAASGAMVALGKSALDAYADYEQLTGGVSTLFGAQDRSLEEYAASVGKSVDEARGEYDKLLQAQNEVLDNASEAFRTAGLSQNEYMETVTSFSAALIAFLGGDTLKAAEVADKAIIDMADNANKMGSSMESIQNAYQGFAKQNYTMLDNLKLGYGGTKSEMERLLADAEAISGVHYDIESYADVVEAIHVIQDEMGITGTTAKEAAETISGSVASAKSAWSNMVVGIADDEQDFDKLTNDFVESAATAAENILPRVETILGGMGKLVTSMSGVIADAFVGFTEYIPDLTEAGVSLVDALVQGMVDNAPALAMAAADVIQALVDTIADSLPELIQAVLDIIVSLAKAIVAAAPTICKAIIDLIPILINALISSIPTILNCITDIINAVVEALPDLIIMLVEALPDIIVAIVETLIEAIPQILEAAVQMFMAIVEAIPEILVALVTGLGELLGKIGEFLKNIIVSIAQWAIEMREKARQAAKDFLDNVVTFFKELPGKIWDNLTAAIKHVISWGLELSKNMVEGLWNGIKNMGQWIKDKIFGFADGIIFLCL
ncbi:phage tail protein [Ruminococcus sp.]